MRFSIFSILLITCLTSCDPDADLCAELISRIDNQQLRGTIFLCNAQPPDMMFLNGTATLHIISQDLIEIHLVSDTAMIDTTLAYEIDCMILETEAGIYLNSNDEHSGAYNQYPDRIFFSFGFPNCLNNTGFEGYVQ